MFKYPPDSISKVRCIPLVAIVLVLSFEPLRAAAILTNGGFTGSLSSWTASGTLFNTGDAAVFSDAVAAPTSIFQSGALPLDLISLELVFDVFNGLSPSVIGGVFARLVLRDSLHRCRAVRLVACGWQL